METERISIETMRGAKRQRFPYKLHWECPNCGKECVTDFTDRYISYPKWGEPSTVGLFCLDCDEVEPITEVTLTPDIMLTVDT